MRQSEYNANRELSISAKIARNRVIYGGQGKRSQTPVPRFPWLAVVVLIGIMYAVIKALLWSMP